MFPKVSFCNDVKIVAICMSGKCAFGRDCAFVGNNEFIFRETVAIQLFASRASG